jgi:hypothetical protein
VAPRGFEPPTQGLGILVGVREYFALSRFVGIFLHLMSE